MAAVLMTMTMLQLNTEVYADGVWDVTKFATVEKLKTFNTNGSDGAQNSRKVYFGSNGQQWWIAGSQNGNLTLFAASPLAYDKSFEPDAITDKTYNDDWGCYYSDSEPQEVTSNHYGASTVRMTTLWDLEQTCFSNAEQALMEPTTIYTNDAANNGVYSTQDKLYLAYGDDNSDYVTVGTNGNSSLNDGLRVDKAYWGNDAFWLRTPDADNIQNALLANPGFYVSSSSVNTNAAVVPAFELDLSSVAFASVAPSATRTSEDVYSLLNRNDPNLSDAFTLRYETDGLGTLEFTKQTISYRNVPHGTSLVVQNNGEAWALSISGNGTVSAGKMKVTDLSDCEVWMEKSDTVARKTYAVRGTRLDGNSVINEPKGLTAVYGQKLSEITLPEGWTWIDGDTIVEAGLQHYSARFNTADYESEYDFTGVEGYHKTDHYVERSLEVNVSKDDSAITIVSTGDSLSKTYDGKPVSEPEVKKNGSTKDVSFSWYRKDGNDWTELTSAPSEAGSYKVVASVEADDNYNGTSAEQEFSISQAENAWTEELSIAGWTYGDPANAPTAKAKYGTVTFTYSGSKDGNYTDTVPTDAGTWYVKASVAGSASYPGLEMTKSFEIRKAVPQFEIPNDLTIVQGQTLSTVKLPEGFVWKDAAQTVDTLGKQIFRAIYTPDSKNYQAVETSITVNVVAKNVSADHTDEIPQTGDSTNIFVWYAVLAVSLAGAVSSILFRHRKQA